MKYISSWLLADPQNPSLSHRPTEPDTVPNLTEELRAFFSRLKARGLASDSKQMSTFKEKFCVDRHKMQTMLDEDNRRILEEDSSS